MEIDRMIGGKPYRIELDDDELYQAYLEKEKELTVYKIMQYLDAVEEVGGIPTELLQSERFADKALVQVQQMENSYEANIAAAVSMAVDYEIRSNTLEDTVCASTADIIVAKLSAANSQYQTDSASLAATLKSQPDSVIRSLRQGAAADTSTAGQQSCLSSCISTVEKFKAITYVGRGINEREDYDDYDFSKNLRNEREVTGYYDEIERQQEETLDLTQDNSRGRTR